MKKITALLLALILVISVCVLPLHAVEESLATESVEQTGENEKHPSSDSGYITLRENSVVYTCRYQADSKTVAISGTVNHDVMVTHADHTIAVYQVDPGQTLEESLRQTQSQALATTAIAVKFQFSFQAESISQRFARYAVVLLSPTGEILLTDEPQYAAVESTLSDFSGDKSGMKGIRTGMLSIGGGLNAGSAIVEVSLDRLLSQTSSGYLYHIGDSYRYFDKSYVDFLDASVRTYSASGCRVYLQFLFSELSSNEEQTASADASSDFYSEETMLLISSFVEFLVSRYDSYQNGRICGLIVGEAIDRIYAERYLAYDVFAYAESYAFLLTVVANSAWVYQSDLDIVLPFSDQNCYQSQENARRDEGSASALLESILRILEDRLSVEFPCSTLIESQATAQSIMKPFAKDTKASKNTAAHTTIGVENMEIYSEYLSRLSDRFAHAPNHFMLVWEVPHDCGGNVLASAYAYSFYRLLSEEKLSAFIVSFSESEKIGRTSVFDIEKIIRYIDTEKSFAVTDNLLTYFHAERWQDILSVPALSDWSIRHFERADPFDLTSLAIKGSFSYAEFPKGNISGWYAGAFCGEIKSDYSKDGQRILRASLQTKNTVEHADVLHLYEYTENYAYTPYLSFDLCVFDGGNTTDRLCEVIVTLGNEQRTVVAEYIVSVNQRTCVNLDIGSYVTDGTVDYIKIGTRMLSAEPSSYTMALYDVVGYSTVYSSDELNTLIEEERARIRNQEDPSEDGSGVGSLTWIIFGVLLAVSAVGGGLFLFFKKSEEKPRDDTENEGSSDKRRDFSE